MAPVPWTYLQSRSRKQLTRCHSEVYPHRENDGRGRKESRNDKVFLSQQSITALSGCIVCECASVCVCCHESGQNALLTLLNGCLDTHSARMYLQGFNLAQLGTFFSSAIWQHNEQPLFQSPWGGEGAHLDSRAHAVPGASSQWKTDS